MITCERYKNILEIKIDVGKGNLFSFSHLEQLGKLVSQAETDCFIDGVVITGTGHCFSTGLDISSMLDSAGETPWSDTFQALDRLLADLFRFPKPFVAAINGHSVGAGFLIQLCSDYVLVADNDRMKFGLPELSLGLTIDCVMMHLANYGLSSCRLLQYFLYSGDLFGSAKALQIGIVDEIVAGESLLITAHGQVMRLLRGGQAAFSRTKQILRCDTILKMDASLTARSHLVFDDLLLQEKYAKMRREILEARHMTAQSE